MRTWNPNSIAKYSILSAVVKDSNTGPLCSWTQVLSVSACFEDITNWRCTDQLCRLCQRAIVAHICTLPDNVLLEIFSLYVDCAAGPYEDAWHTLVHICRRWRYVVFASPRRLDLQLRCTIKRSAQKMLDVWPALPIAIEFRSGIILHPQVANNIIIALNQCDRIRKIDLCPPIPFSLLNKIRAIKEPLPVLTDLRLVSNFSLPDSFLGGSAPHLRSLHLLCISFPALPKLLLSTTELVTLYISDIPHRPPPPPETIVTNLSTLTKLQKLSIGFHSSDSPADDAGRVLPPLTRVVLPALTSLELLSYDECLENFVSRLDAPLLNNMTVERFKRAFDTRQLRYFISHTEAFKPLHLHRAEIDIAYDFVSLIVFSQGAMADHELLKFTTPRKRSDWVLFDIFAQFCISALPPLPTLKRLDVRKSGRHWQYVISNLPWLEFFRPLTSVTDLALSDTAAVHVASALRRLPVEDVTNILPALQNIFLKVSAQSGSTQEAIEKFVATRQLSDRPVTVVYED